METQVSPELIEFIEANGNFYGLACGFEGIKVVWCHPSPLIIQKAERDFNLFQERQKAINSRTKITEGDWIIRKDGKYEGVSVASHGHVQAGGHGGVYISQNGIGSYSGSCGDCIEPENLVLTEETKQTSCWIFSGDSAGAHRGVWHRLQIKVWKEI